MRYCPAPDLSGASAAALQRLGYIPTASPDGKSLTARESIPMNFIVSGGEEVVSVVRVGDSVQIAVYQTATLHEGGTIAYSFGQGDEDRMDRLPMIVDAVLAGCSTPSRDADGSTDEGSH